MADHDQEKNREHLTEREREALQILASEFVKEAGLQRKAKRDEDWVEGEKLLHESAKTQALITAGLLGASGAAWFIPEPKDLELLGAAVSLGIFSLTITLTHMYIIAQEIRMPFRFPGWARFVVDGASGLSFIVALGLLSAYISRNI